MNTLIKKILFTFLFMVFSITLQAEVTASQMMGIPSSAKSNTQPQKDTIQTAFAIPKTLQSPRATMKTFIHGMNDVKRGQSDAINPVLSTLDLSKINKLVSEERGKVLAWMLLEAIDKTSFIDFSTIPNQQQGKEWIFGQYGKPPNKKISIKYQEDGRWLFSTETLEQLPDILDELKTRISLVSQNDDDSAHKPWSVRIQEHIPVTLKERFLGLFYWQWLGIFIFVLLGITADAIFSGLAHIITRFISMRANGKAYQKISSDLLRPFGLMIMALVWWLGINQLALPENALLVLLVAVKFFASVSGVWGAYRLVDLISAWMKTKANQTTNKVDDAIVPLAKRTMKIFVTVVGLVFIANNLNINITGLVAGLGLGGLALALASKDLAQNLFGTITVLIEGTFSVGDWIVVGDIEGTVEDISFRSTRIRTFYNSLITLPNANLITSSVDNFGKRRYRRMSTKLGITYNTAPDEIEGFCEGIREIVRLHPYMRKDYYQVYFNGYADSALEILVYVFWDTPDWNTELREKHRFLLDVLRLANSMGIEFAYPTQTVFWKEMQYSNTAPTESQTVDKAFESARQLARNIVEKNVSLDNKPDPVSIDRQPLSKSNI